MVLFSKRCSRWVIPLFFTELKENGGLLIIKSRLCQIGVNLFMGVGCPVMQLDFHQAVRVIAMNGFFKQ